VLNHCAEWLDLARRPVTTIDSVIENGTEIGSTGYRLAGSAGRLQRRSGSCATLWQRDCDIVVTYSAGWATVPDDLARAAIKFVQAEWNQGSRDGCEHVLAPVEAVHGAYLDTIHILALDAALVDDVGQLSVLSQ
jgi:hypothetical protein